MAARYNFSAEDLQRRAELSSELKAKSMEQRAKAATAGGPKKKADDSKKVAEEKPQIDFAELKAKARDRRNFLAGTGAFATAMTITALGSNRFMFPRVLFEPPSSFTAGKIDDYLPNQPVFFKDFKTWIIRTPGRIFALSGRCTHLGCTPAWLSSDAKFKCPCHGSGFRMSGVNFEGPAPRALERFKISLAGETLQIDKSKMFLFEKGDWEKPESFLIV